MTRDVEQVAAGLTKWAAFVALFHGAGVALVWWAMDCMFLVQPSAKYHTVFLLAAGSFFLGQWWKSRAVARHLEGQKP